MALDFFAGCVGGAAGILVGHPLDTVKVKIQTDCPVNPKYKGTFHCLSSIVKQESASGLYKGITSPLYGVGAMNALFFGVYGLLTPIVRDHGNNALWAHFAAGATAGAIQSVIAAPTELAKIRMQLSEAAVEGTKVTSAGKGPSTWGVIKQTYLREGLRKGVFKGWCVTLSREIPGLGTYIATYEAMTAKRGADITTPEMLLAGGLAGVASWVACFPMDVVKTRYQSDMGGKYSSAIDCFRKTISTEGYKALFRGLNSTVIRAFPTNAATFAAVAWVHKLAHKLSASEETAFVDLENIFKLPIITQEVESQLAMLIQHRLPSYNFMTSAAGSSSPSFLSFNVQDYWSHLPTVAAGAEVAGPDSTKSESMFPLSEEETSAAASSVVVTSASVPVHYVPSSNLIVATPTASTSSSELVSEEVICHHHQDKTDSTPLRVQAGKILDRVKKEIMEVASEDKGLTLFSLVLEWLVRTGASLNVCKCFVDALDHCVCFQR